MQLAGYRSCLVFSLIELIIAGGVNASNKLESRSAVFNRAGNEIINLRRRRRQQPIHGRNTEQDFFPVIIGVNDGSDGVLESMFPRLSSFVRPKFKRINAISALLSREELYALEQDPNIMYIEDDPIVYPDSSEAALYGLRMVQAFAPIISKQNFTGTAACNNPSSFKIGIIDSGLAM
jgi:hypothetical protein